MSNPFNSPEVFVVEASAGSGKTYALVKRYVQILMHISARTPVALKHVLAITFTNKAAGEMKSRIIDLLKRIALEQLPLPMREDICAPLGMEARHCRDLAARLMEEIIRNYHFFGVQTIDSFMNTLLAGCAFKVNLSARFKIKRDAKDYLQLSLDGMIDAAHGDKKVRELFEAFIRQYLFLENRGGWSPKKDLLGTMMVLFNQYTTYQMPFLTFSLTGMDVGEYKRQFLKLARQMRELLPEATDKRFRQALEGFIEDHPIGFDMDDVSRYFAREGVPVNAKGNVPCPLDSLWQESRQILRALCLQEAYAAFNPYIGLFDGLMSRLSCLQTKEDVLFLQQLNQKTGALFDEGLVTVEELYYRLATRFNHYLIDEFQDTSAAQWHNLRMMVEESLSTGGTLFYVGDKKQAIYSFRGGQTGLFDQVQREFAHFNVHHEVLRMNYRSNRAIVDFNNCIFSPVNLRKFMLHVQDQSLFKDNDIVFNDEDTRRVEHIFGSAQQVSREDLTHGAVRVRIISGRKKKERLDILREQVVALVKEMRTRFAARDIAVLARNNAQVQMLTQWLMHEGIHAQSDRTSDVKNHPLIKELAAFLRFLHSPIDNSAFVEFLSGGLFAAVSGLSGEDTRDFLFSCRQPRAAGSEQYFYKHFREAYPELWQSYFEDFFTQAGIYPLYELVVGICGRWHCVRLFPGAQGFVMHFLELIKRREEDSCDLETFLEYFDALEDDDRFVPMPAQDAVRVLTVHKAKGLEFSAVIIPFLEMTIKVGSADKDGARSFIWDEQENGMRLLRLKESYIRFSDELRQRYVLEYKKAFFAELNNVYVALTRAVWEMHVFVPERVGNSVNPLPFLIPEELFDCGSPVAVEAKTGLVFAHRILPLVEYQPWIGRLQEEFLRETAAQAQIRQQGEVTHFCLSQLGNLAGIDTVKAIDDALRQTAARFTRAAFDRDAYSARLHFLMKMPLWRTFFFLPEEAQVLCEQEVVNAFGDTRRVDRLIILPKEIWVVDFKASRADAGNHQRQLDEYIDLLADIYPGRAVSGYLLYFNENIHG